MENSKLIKLLKSLSKQEIIRLKELVNSPYFNKNRNVMNLCEEILNFYPGFNSIEFTEENIYKKLFGSLTFDYFKIKNIISDLYGLAVT